MIHDHLPWDSLANEGLTHPSELLTGRIIWSTRDLFAPDVATNRIVDAYARMLSATQHTFLVRSDNPSRMEELTSSSEFTEAVRQALRALTGEDGYLLTNGWWAEQNIWLGVRARNQYEAQERHWPLISARTHMRFLDCRGQTGPIDLYACLFGEKWAWNGEHPNIPGMNTLKFIDGLGYGIDLVIAGPCPDPNWARSLRDQCYEGGTSFNYTPGQLDGKTWDANPAYIE